MFFTLMSLIDILAAMVALYAINFGGLEALAYVLLVFLFFKGLYSLMSTLR